MLTLRNPVGIALLAAVAAGPALAPVTAAAEGGAGWVGGPWVHSGSMRTSTVAPCLRIGPCW